MITDSVGYSGRQGRLMAMEASISRYAPASRMAWVSANCDGWFGPSNEPHAM